MREEPRPAFDTDEADEAWLNSDQCLSVDWKASPYDVLDLMDDALKAHGLEVVIYESTGDSYDWRIDRRQE